MQMWRKFLRLRPWFRLPTAEGEVINGQVMADNSLELTIKSGWSEQRLKLSTKEVEALVVWMVKHYYKKVPVDGKSTEPTPVISISRGKRDPETGPPGAG